MSSVQQPAWAASPPAQKPNITDSEPTAIVQVENVATIPTDLLQVAENRAGEVFQKIGACVTWVDTTRAARRRIGTMFTLVLVNIEQSRSPYQRRQDVLGFAAPSVSRAWVFWDRIEAAKARAPCHSDRAGGCNGSRAWASDTRIARTFVPRNHARRDPPANASDGDVYEA